MANELELSTQELAHELAGPALEPAAGELPGARSPTFAAECLAGIRTLPSSEQWVLGAEFITHSDQWGDIWRVDFEIDGESYGPLVNRLVSWRRADGTIPVVIAIGQNVPPLVIDGK
ncbi:MAG: hypothetical protein Q8K93_30510 [Reyranella sp.]|uniref:hypothetical protein n=1 Tax=Reyranella sp. TaxID=1929291 RepID=UPI00272F3CF6|nr:hypothetical protein [Reyranella sp.]MDP1966525.1 hypothetical protein [Reyranella sp.]MDP2373638.1 hypothetical protein [Reyranella sp.]